MGPRNGGEADRENIMRLLTRARFDSVHVHNDVERKDILEIMDGISNSPEIGTCNRCGLGELLARRSAQRVSPEEEG